MPQNLFWKIPDSLCLGIYRLKAKKRQREISSLTSSCLPRTPTNVSMIIQKVKALNLKLCRTLIHTHPLNKQEKRSDKTKNQNAKSRACLKAVFLKKSICPFILYTSLIKIFPQAEPYWVICTGREVKGTRYGWIVQKEIKAWNTTKKKKREFWWLSNTWDRNTMTAAFPAITAGLYFAFFSTFSSK